MLFTRVVSQVEQCAPLIIAPGEDEHVCAVSDRRAHLAHRGQVVLFELRVHDEIQLERLVDLAHSARRHAAEEKVVGALADDGDGLDSAQLVLLDHACGVLIATHVDREEVVVLRLPQDFGGPRFVTAIAPASFASCACSMKTESGFRAG